MIDISIIIVSFNTAKLTVEAIASIEKAYQKEVTNGQYEVIVFDNDSTDDSVIALREYKKQSKIKVFMILESKKNLGFAKANNASIKKAKGRYVLFLNPDTVMYPQTLPTIIGFMDKYTDAGACGCQLNIPSGGIDEASHRGFPTPWNAFCHFSGLEKKFPHSRLFAGYTRGWENMNTIHEVPAIAGAFMLVRREAGEKIGWWDEDYFFYGEDLDFCYSLHEKGYAIYYVPTVHILHYGGVSSGIKKQSQDITTANIERKRMVQRYRFDAMRIFYRKHYLKKYPTIINWFVLKGIDYLYQSNVQKLAVAKAD